MKGIIADERLSEYCTALEGEHVNLIVTQPKPSNHFPSGDRIITFPPPL